MKIYNKLIRDSIPEIIEQSGDRAKIRVLDEEEYKRALLEKVAEEAEEVLTASSDKKELEKEIGDVYEVIDAVIQAFGLDREEIERVKADRKKKRGGFEKRLFLESTD